MDWHLFRVYSLPLHYLGHKTATTTNDQSSKLGKNLEIIAIHVVRFIELDQSLSVCLFGNMVCSRPQLPVQPVGGIDCSL